MVLTISSMEEIQSTFKSTDIRVIVHAKICVSPALLSKIAAERVFDIVASKGSTLGIAASLMPCEIMSVIA